MIHFCWNLRLNTCMRQKITRYGMSILRSGTVNMRGKKNFIAEAIKKPGALRKALGAKAGKPIPAGKLEAAAKAPGKMGQRARFAMTLKGMK
jgi:hypothetical protein